MKLQVTNKSRTDNYLCIMNEIEKRLEARGIKPTAMRILVLKAMLEYHSAFSLADIEDVLETVDKSTLSRTINLFHDKLLIHSIDDGSGSMKYSVCSSDCECRLNQLHVHFHCNRCNNTYCLESIHIPPVKLPPGFLLENVNFVMKGYCDMCSKFAT